jgi:hypothetical protein
VKGLIGSVISSMLAYPHDQKEKVLFDYENLLNGHWPVPYVAHP